MAHQNWLIINNFLKNLLQNGTHDTQQPTGPVAVNLNSKMDYCWGIAVQYWYAHAKHTFPKERVNMYALRPVCTGSWSGTDKSKEKVARRSLGKSYNAAERAYDLYCKIKPRDHLQAMTLQRRTSDPDVSFLTFSWQ